MCELSLKSKPFLVVICFNLLLTSHSFVDALRSSLCLSSFSLGSMSIPCCCKNSIAFVWLKETLYIIFDQIFCSKVFSLREMKYPSFSTFGNSRDIFFPLWYPLKWKKAFWTRRRPHNSLLLHFLWSVFVSVLEVHRWLMLSGYCLVSNT